MNRDREILAHLIRARIPGRRPLDFDVLARAFGVPVVEVLRLELRLRDVTPLTKCHEGDTSNDAG